LLGESLCWARIKLGAATKPAAIAEVFIQSRRLEAGVSDVGGIIE